MLPPELQPRSYRPHISSSASAPTFSSSIILSGSYSPERSPNPSPSLDSSTNGLSSRSSSNSRSSLLKNSRYSPSTFTHNARIAIALVPCAAFLLDLGGTPVVATLTFGLMISYILDSLNFKPGAFFGVWFSLSAAQIAFFFSSSLVTVFNSFPLAVLAAFLCAEANFLIGVWCSLQFKWIQMENPSIVLALERLLFACVLLLLPPSLPGPLSLLLAWQMPPTI